MNKLERLATAPMSASSAEFLAEVYGGPGATIDDYAESLPSDATIMDVGAGRSDFGLEIARRRSDVICVNLDIQYKSLDKLEPMRRAAAETLRKPNLVFVYGDILDLSEYMQVYDRVHAYNIVNHLLHIRRDLGRQAVEGMLGLLNKDGRLSMGPTPGQKRGTVDTPDSITLPASASSSDREAALNALNITGWRGWLLDATNASGVSVMQARRSDPDASGYRLFDHRDETYHRPLSPQGLALAARLTAGFAQRNKFEDPPA